MKIRVRNQITGKEYLCREEDFRAAKKNGAALIRVGVEKEEPKKQLSFEKKLPGEEKPKKAPRKRATKKKIDSKESDKNKSK